MSDDRPDNPEQTFPTRDTDPLISQDELDRAIAAAHEAARKHRAETRSPEPAAMQETVSPPTISEPLPPDRGILKQEELNDAIRRHSHAQSAAATLPAAIDLETQERDAAGVIEPPEAVGQDEIDRMLAAIGNSELLGGAQDTREPAGVDRFDSATGEAPDVPADRGRTTVTQDELDRALAASRDAVAEARAEAQSLPKEPARFATAPPPEVPARPLPADLGPISQVELDHAVAAHDKSKTPVVDSTPKLKEDGTAETDSVIQDEGDRILRATQEQEPLESPVDSSGVGSISQEEIDEVLKADAGNEVEVAPPKNELDDFGQVDQDAIDRLIRQATGEVTAKHEAQSPPLTPAQETGPDESPPMPQKPADSHENVPATENRAEAVEPDRESEAGSADKGTLGQDDIDSLLAAMSGSAPAVKGPAEEDEPPVEESVEPDAGTSPAPEVEGEDEEQLGQAELDELLAAFSTEDKLVNQGLDDRLTESDAADTGDMDAEVAPQSEPAEAAPPPEPLDETPVETEPDVEDPVARAERGAAESQVGSENLAAAVPEADELIESIISGTGAKAAPSASEKQDDAVDLAIPSTEELDATIAEGAPVAPSSRDDMVVQLGDEELNEVDVQSRGLETGDYEATPALRKDFRRSLLKDLRSRLGKGADSGSLKTWSSLAAGILCAIGTFLFLQANQHRLPDMSLLPAAQYSDLSAVLRNARQLIDMEEYQEAESLLEPIVKNRAPSPQLAELQYLHIEAKYRQLPTHITDREAESMHRAIDELIALAPTFQGNPDLLRWKAGLYERSGALAAALSTYRGLMTDYLDQQRGDETLIRAARLASEMKRPEESQEFLVRLLQRFPASAYAPEAKLLLGDAQRDAGELEDARKLYTQVALSQDFSPVGAEATARLAQLEIDQGQHAQAIEGLERRLETATTVEGNDAIYLLLAKAYRASGDPAKAETILRELISFFPESPHTAEAFVELSQTLDDIGNRREALRIASHASQRFPENPAVLINEGELQQREGNDAGAAQIYLDAVEAGSGSPATLLAAGHAFARVNELAKARKTFDRLITGFPTTPEAFDGSIALAQVLQKQGQSQAALERLTNLAEASAGRPQQIALLQALGDLYGELGFRDRAAEQYEAVAAITDDATALARSATALIDAGEAGPGMAVARRVDASALAPDMAYDFLTNFAKVLLQMDTALALEKMEQAYNAYPDQRTEEGDRDLLNAYLVTGQTARARALVMDLSGYVRDNPGAGPRLQRTAIQWADALYSRGDFTAAVEGYALAVEADPDGADAAWARFQQANALMELKEYGTSLELLDAVAESSAPYAEDARLKAEYARLEQRLRGERPQPQLGG
ncbi:MAG: tetratricopeptide repeat protein [Candidatus Hydrogenedentes bacterium]|nr:tetratricopeptide repeat protein [Candidatus Hydrogenedentota bacterium]